MVETVAEACKHGATNVFDLRRKWINLSASATKFMRLFLPRRPKLKTIIAERLRRQGRSPPLSRHSAVRLMVRAAGPRSGRRPCRRSAVSSEEMDLLLTLAGPIDQRHAPQFLAGGRARARGRADKPARSESVRSIGWRARSSGAFRPAAVAEREQDGARLGEPLPSVGTSCSTFVLPTVTWHHGAHVLMRQTTRVRRDGQSPFASWFDGLDATAAARSDYRWRNSRPASSRT